MAQRETTSTASIAKSAPRSTCHHGIVSVPLGDHPSKALPSLSALAGCPLSKVEDALDGLPPAISGERKGDPAAARIDAAGARLVEMSVGGVSVFEGSIGTGVRSVASLVKLAVTELLVAM